MLKPFLPLTVFVIIKYITLLRSIIYFDFNSGVASDHLRPSSLAISPTLKFGFASRTLGRTSFENQKKADLEQNSLPLTFPGLKIAKMEA